MKNIGLLLILFGIVVATLAWRNPHIFDSKNPSTHLQALWNEDFDNLKSQNKLPKVWPHIRSVELTGMSAESRKWISHLRAPVELDPQGNYKLEVGIDNWQDEKNYGAVLQFHLIELNNSNTIWESGRTYTLGKL